MGGIDSLFITNNKTETLTAVKHWGPETDASICERVFEKHNEAMRTNTRGSCLAIENKDYAFFQSYGEITYIATCNTETQPLMVVEFLTQLHEVLKSYFGDTITEAILQEHHLTLYQLLDEMLDSGIPVNTHPGGLQVIVPPPNLANRLHNAVLGTATGVLVSDQDPTKLLPLPWRASNIKYASNEVYLDVIEQVDATLDPEGKLLTSAIYGKIEVNCRLSGMPDISLSLSNSHLIEDYSFHPSVRLARFASDRVISFVPADGKFTLMNYKIRAESNEDKNTWQPKYIKQNPWMQSQTQVGSSAGGINGSAGSISAPLPIYIRPQSSFGPTQGRISIVCGTKPAFEKPVEAVSLQVQLPSRVLSADPSATHGGAVYDDASKTISWTIDKFPANKTPCLTVVLGMGSEIDAINNENNNKNKNVSSSQENEIAATSMLALADKQKLNSERRKIKLQETCNVTAKFSVAGVGVSGVKVETLQVRNEKYKPSQGVRYHTRNGRIVVRT
jgi:AP-3 complex subunit mu